MYKATSLSNEYTSEPWLLHHVRKYAMHMCGNFQLEFLIPLEITNKYVFIAVGYQYQYVKMKQVSDTGYTYHLDVLILITVSLTCLESPPPCGALHDP